MNLFKFHHFDNLRGNSSSSTKVDPRVTKTESSAQILFDLLFCVAANDISSLRRSASDWEWYQYNVLKYYMHVYIIKEIYLYI